MEREEGWSGMWISHSFWEVDMVEVVEKARSGVVVAINLSLRR